MSLIANYAFDSTDYNSGNGTTITDQSGNGNSLTKTGSGGSGIQMIHLMIVIFTVSILIKIKF